MFRNKKDIFTDLIPMTVTRSFWLILLGMTVVVVCASGLRTNSKFSSSSVNSNSVSNDTVNNDTVNDDTVILCRFETQVQNRSRQYLDSLRNRTVSLTPELRQKIESQALDAVGKGLVKLNHSAELVQKQAESADLATIAGAVQKVKKISAMNVVRFLCDDFYRPTELDVAVRVAVPTWNFSHYRMLVARNSNALFEMFGLDFANCNAMTVPTTPRNLKMLVQILGQLSIPVSTIETDSVFRRSADEILPSFTLIAQTVIRRE